MCSPPGNRHRRFVSNKNGIYKLEISGIFRVTIKQLDRNALRPAQEAYFDTGPGGVRHLGELDAFLLQIGGYGIDPGDSQAEVVEALIGRRCSRIDAVARIDLGREKHRTGNLDVESRLS